MDRKRILTGMRPTGKLHLGHYAGALESWLDLQDEYECYFLIADYQALGDHLNDIERIRGAVLDVAMDWLAVGLNPESSAFCIQSYVPEHAELTMFLSMLTPLSALERNPTLKTEIKQQTGALSAGFYMYPVSQIADILLPRAHLVPVGEDQVPHIELTRTIARRFNRTYGETFPEPHATVGRVARLVGIDGQNKMGKSLDNAIYLSDSPDELRRKVRRMVTDISGKNPRLKATDPGIVENNAVFSYLDAFDTDLEGLEALKEQYRKGGIRDSEIKNRLVSVLNDFLDPIRQRRSSWERRIDDVKDVLRAGSERERALAQETISSVRDRMQVMYI